MKYLVAGLGNPGPEYAYTRHNIGFLVADRLADMLGVTFKTERYADHAEGRYKGRIIHLVKPNTYMNLSGKALSYWKQQVGIELAQIMVVTDDLALPYGTLRMRAKGSDGGHNGLKSITEVLGSADYPRLRFGISNNFSKGRQVDYVLGQWNTDEQKELETLIQKSADGVLEYATAGISLAMNKYNT